MKKYINGLDLNLFGYPCAWAWINGRYFEQISIFTKHQENTKILLNKSKFSKALICCLFVQKCFWTNIRFVQTWFWTNIKFIQKCFWANLRFVQVLRNKSSLIKSAFEQICKCFSMNIKFVQKTCWQISAFD